MMDEKNTVLTEPAGRIIAACGNDCSACPRYTAAPYEKTEEELRHTAELWMKIGYRDHVVSAEEISCKGCSTDNWCRYHVVKCCTEKGITNCAECSAYPCGNLKDCFAVTASFEPDCRKACTKEEYEEIRKAFFEKEKNLDEIRKKQEGKMTQIKINELMITYPESFHEMDETEKAGLNFFKEGPGVCLSAPELHILVSIGWKKSGFASLLVSEKEAAENGEKQIRKAMSVNVYQLDKYTEYTLDGKAAYGYRYTYQVQDVGMTGENVVLKHNKVFYYLNFYARTELMADSLPVWQEMLDSIHFGS